MEQKISSFDMNIYAWLVNNYAKPVQILFKNDHSKNGNLEITGNNLGPKRGEFWYKMLILYQTEAPLYKKDHLIHRHKRERIVNENA